MIDLCLLGEIIVDVTLRDDDNKMKMRLGGIIHSARALWAMDSNYHLAYVSPDYLDSRIQQFIPTLGNPSLMKIATTTNSPNLILINEVKEVGDQGYELILRDEVSYAYNNDIKLSYNNILITWGQFSLQTILKSIELDNATISLEIGENSLDEIEFSSFENLYVSTSSKFFKDYMSDKDDEFVFEEFIEFFRPYCNQVIFKENRGGTRLYSFKEEKTYQVSSQTRKIVHSVGVGDVFNAIYESHFFDNIHDNLTFASFVAMEYACTTYPVDFKESIKRYKNLDISNLRQLEGIILNWEKRSSINIYMAAPDFDFVNTAPIELLYSSLKYHNFSPRRPIKENGQMRENDTDARKKEIYQSDMRILDECQILVAVLLYNDPGTLVEIGIAAERKMPVILYDPYNIAKNCMLTNSVNYVYSDLDEVVCEIFQISSKL